MKKLKKIIYLLLLCSMIFIQPIYAAEQENPSTNQSNMENGGYFAEKNHILYYLKRVEAEENHNVLQLYQYDLQTQTDSLLCEDSFQYDPSTSTYHMRVCEDGYIYFNAIKEEGIKENVYNSAYYRVSVNGGKSEYVCKSKEIAFLSDTWIYWSEKNSFYNLVTKETIQNTITNSFDSILLQEPENSSCEYHDVVYLDAYHINLNVVPTTYKNGQPLEKGIYAFPLHEQNAFHKIELEEEAYNFQVYNNNLYYHTGNAIKQYSLQNHTTKTIIEIETENDAIYYSAIYNDTLYYGYNTKKNGKYYPNLYRISLKGKQNQPVIAVPYFYSSQIHILEDVVCCAYVTRAYIGNWRIFDIHTGKRRFITT